MIDFDGNGIEEECCDFVYFDKCSPRLFLETRKLCKEFNEGHHLREIIRRLSIAVIDVRTEIPKFWEENFRFIHSVTMGFLTRKETRRFSDLIKMSHAHKVEFRGIAIESGTDEKISLNLPADPYKMCTVDPMCINSKHTVKLTDCELYGNKAKETIEVLGRGSIHTLAIDYLYDLVSVTALTKEGGGSGSIHSLYINNCKFLHTCTRELTSINELRIERCKWVDHDDESRHKWDEDGFITVGGRCKEGIHRTNVEATT